MKQLHSFAAFLFSCIAKTNSTRTSPPHPSRRRSGWAAAPQTKRTPILPLCLWAATLGMGAGMISAQAQPVGSLFSAAAESDLSKSNQSKVFYHDSKWWAIALLAGDSDWYIWQFDQNTGTWQAKLLLHTSSSRRPDAILDAASNRLFVFLSNSTKSEIQRLSYSGGTWVLDSGFPVTMSDFVDSGTSNPISIVRAHNGALWIFRLRGNSLQAKKSANNGSTWSGILTVKAGLTTTNGTTDGVAFTNASAENCVGVAYAETNASGSRFGFLVHRDNDADHIWLDESAALTFAGGENATDELCATVDGANNVYLLTQNAGFTGSEPRNSLYKRSPAGTWQRFTVNASTTWKNPAAAVDTGNNVLYLLGINTSSKKGEYKSCTPGQETSLAAATATVFFASTGTNNFVDLSVPAPANLGAATALMVCVDNKAADVIWYNQIAFASGGGSSPLSVGNVTTLPNEANANASYTIPITLGSSGALASGAGTISIQFPDNTFVPSSISASAVTINGTAAAAVTANTATRTVTITTPVLINSGSNVAIAFALGANLLNPSSSGNKSLSVWTSAEAAPVASPVYVISPATTSVSAAVVTPNPNSPGVAAAYAVSFNLGARGRLIPASSTITITFNNATTVANGSISNAQINGAAASAAGNSSAKTITLTVPASSPLGNGAVVTVNLPATALTNPATAGNYTLAVATSVETAATVSNPYTISSNTPLSVAAISLSTNEANSNASYTIPLTLGSAGALNAGSGTLTIQFPNNTWVPSGITASQVTVNGTPANAVSSNNSTREIVVTTPIQLGNGANVNLAITAGAGLQNPSHAGSYSLQVWSSAEPAHVVSPAYTITAATTTITAANVTPAPNLIASAAAYAVAFNLGARGRLMAGTSTLTLGFNASTAVSNGNLSNTLVNGVNAVATGNSGNKTVTLTVPPSLSLGNGAAVTVNLPSAAITNPASAGFYTITVASSVEATNVASNVYEIQGGAPTPPSGEDLPIAGSNEPYEKPNQNRPFFHGGKWWTVARLKSNNRWYLWKLEGSTWSSQVELDTRSSTRPDCYVDSPANKLYILLASSSSSGSKVARLSYAAGSWSIDSGFPVTLSNFTFTSEYCMVLTKANNGDLWVFRYRSSQVDAQKSSNNGASWTSTITVKSGIYSTGLVDAVAFDSNGNHYVGVGYAENTGNGNIYGFLKHKDGDPDGVWSDETGAITQFAGADSDDHMSLAVSASHEIFFVVKTHPDAGSAAGIGLLKRTAAGNWQTFTVQQGGGWTRPAVVVDESNNELYVLGTQESGAEHGQYRKCAIGNESSLQNAAVVTIFDGGAFNNISVPQHRVSNSTGLLVCAENASAAEIWYNLLPIGGGGGSAPTPLVINSVTPSPSSAGLGAGYTLALTLGSQGALPSGGTITVTWPDGTTIPANIGSSAVTVNGNSASAVNTNPATRQAFIAIPGALGNGAGVSLAFSQSAGIANPSAGNYALQAQTSAQPSNVNSPTYAIQGISPVIAGNVAVAPNQASQVASYAIPITLGSNGALGAGSGSIMVTWPENTALPASIANANVTVNGNMAAAVACNAAQRQAVITVPNDLANNALVSLVFSTSAGIANPTTAGNYFLQVQTSAQPLNSNSPNYSIAAPMPPTGTLGEVVSATTDGILEGSHQSKLFYFQDKWWLIAHDSLETDWHLWRQESGGWIKGIFVDERTPVRIDAVLDSANNRLYYVSSHEKNTRIGRLQYQNGSWTRMPFIAISGFGHGTSTTAASIARAKDGGLWIFRVSGGMLEARFSGDNGQNWSSTLVLKSGLAGDHGNTKAVAFTANGNRVGVFYGMSASNGGVEYGFLHHQDGAATTAWSDESGSLGFFGAERGDRFISAQAANDGRLFFLTCNSNAAGANEVKNTLYARGTGGGWNKFKVNTGAAWSSPVLGIDESNDVVYLAGVRAATPNYAEFKSCGFGNEASLETQSAVALLQNGSDVFGELTAPSHFVHAQAGLMISGGNTTRNDVWFTLLNLPIAKRVEGSAAEQIVAQTDEQEVSVYPNPFNPATTLRFHLKTANQVRLRIFNIRGELVRTLLDQSLAAGLHERRWNGSDRSGQTVASGVYFYRLEVGSEVWRGRLEMVK